MTTKKIGIFLTLLTISFLIPVGDQALHHFLPGVPRAQASPFDWRQILPGQHDRLRRTLQLIREDYVDPPRVKPSEMLRKSLEQLSLGIPELRVVYEGHQRASLYVAQQKKEIDLHVQTMQSLSATLNDILSFIEQHRITKLRDSDIEASAIGALLSTLDPHSSFLNKEFYKETQVQTKGHFGGLGIVIGIRDEKLTIITPLPDTPASKAKLRAGDTISKINDEYTEGMSLQDAVRRMRGPVRTPVTLTIVRKGWPSSQSFKLIRDKIVVVSVESYLLPQRIGYVRIKNFQQDTGKALEAQLKALETKAGGSLKGLILDLRNNPGGILDQAVSVSDHFLKEGAIVSTVGPNGVVYAREDAGRQGLNLTTPMVTLINHGSASASEIVAGALHGNQRSLILGTTSFGKGTVQRIYDLPMESALKLTIAKYLTPGGVSIQSRGIVPDVETQPYVISKNGFNLLLREKRPGESHLEKSFTPGKVEAASPQEKPLLDLRYVEKVDDPIKERDLSESAQSDEKIRQLLEDFDVSLASKILLKTPSPKHEDLVSAAQQLAPMLRQEQSLKLKTELERQGIDWTVPVKPSPAQDCGLQTQSRLLKDGKPIANAVAGEKVALELTLKNPGTCTLYGTLVQTESKRYFFDDLEFVFGKVLPGTTVTRTLNIEVPKSMISSTSEVDFKVVDYRLSPIHTDRKTLSIRSAELPKFSISYLLDDSTDTGLAKGNGNGVIERGETIRVSVTVENIGKAMVKTGSVDLYVPDTQGVEGRNVHAALKDLDVGQKQTFDFYVSVLQQAPKEHSSLRLSVIDTAYRVYQTKEIEFPIENRFSRNMTSLSPPVVTTDLSKHQGPLSDQFLKVTGSAKDREGLQDLYIIVNEKKAFYQPLSQKEGRFETSIPLEPGENQILVVVRDKDELIHSERYILVREGNTAPLVTDDGEAILE